MGKGFLVFFFLFVFFLEGEERGVIFFSSSGNSVCSGLILIRAIMLAKNSQFFVRQGDVERLIAQGYLQKLS